MHFQDYPENSSFFTEINHRKMHYLANENLQAEPVVMIHGNPSWSFYYRYLFSALSDNYYCIAPDHIGMGLSEKPDNNYSFTLEQRVDDLEVLLDKLAVTRDITLVMHDWGGMIGLAYATRHPDRIKRLVISNTAGFHIPAGKKIPWQLQLSRLPILGKLAIQGFNAFCRGAVNQCVTRKPLIPEIASAYISPYDSWHNRLSVLRFVEDIPLKKTHISFPIITEVDNQLNQFASLPMMICWGLNDFVFDRDFLNEWKRRFPNADYHEYDAGHYLLEDAGDEVIPAIQTFLQDNP